MKFTHLYVSDFVLYATLFRLTCPTLVIRSAMLSPPSLLVLSLFIPPHTVLLPIPFVVFPTFPTLVTVFPLTSMSIRFVFPSFVILIRRARPHSFPVSVLVFMFL